MAVNPAHATNPSGSARTIAHALEEIVVATATTPNSSNVSNRPGPSATSPATRHKAANTCHEALRSMRHARAAILAAFTSPNPPSRQNQAARLPKRGRPNRAVKPAQFSAFRRRQSGSGSRGHAALGPSESSPCGSSGRASSRAAGAWLLPYASATDRRGFHRRRQCRRIP